MTTNTLVLIVEDDPSLVELLSYNLQSAGFDTQVETDGEGAIAAIENRTPDIIILDWMIPNLSGIDVCRRVRAMPENHDVPIIMLTARSEETDKILGLEVGADDYMVKPFSPKELIARIHAILRRSRPETGQKRLEYAGIVMDTIAHRVTRDGEPVHLGPTEYRLLRVFLEKPGRVYSRDNLLDRAWDANIHVEPRTVDVHIRRLRKALNEGGHPDIIRTVRSAGYA
ncbi:MAG: phosphate regulon transcriptional regulator PhoB, partial [Rhodospirillales bacterium]|nr:phosphate regulon transcriptional regulator PhoB [Rhodospirillales bacterium]